MATVPKIIGLTGLAGSGKDTVRNILEQDHGFSGMAFADPIRAMLHRLFNFCGVGSEYMEVRELKEQPIPGIGLSYRELAQTLGTEWGREQHPDFWIRIAQASLRDDSTRSFGPLRIVFSDVRFPNEVAMIRELGGEIWRIDRPGLEPVRDHESESNVSGIKADRVLVNNSSIDSLWILVASILDRESCQ